MNATILLIGDYPALLASRAALLKRWATTVADTRSAPLLLKESAYDFLILCQTVSDESAMQLVDLACSLNPKIKVLAFVEPGETRDLGIKVKHHMCLDHPALLEPAVADILKSSLSGCADAKGLVEASTT